jgi:hypothetical protein
LKASMPVKCMDQIPVPIANAPPASYTARALPSDAATLPARSSAV